jgi:hypothetical protein
MLIDSSQRIVVGGVAMGIGLAGGPADFALARYDSTGRLDPTFNPPTTVPSITFGAGIVTTKSGEWVKHVRR